MKHIFGPVPSRRLGLSLGIDIIPFKTCTLSCIYCQIGNTPEPTRTRREYTPPNEILAEIREYLIHHPKPDFISFSGSGEPTLHSGLGALIHETKILTDTPVCVITNGTTLMDPEVRRDLLEADVVMPSLDSAREESFRAACRPESTLHVDEIIRGLADFRREYPGKIWLEILFVSGVNDSPEDLEALRDAIEIIQPDSIQLNTVARPPAENAARPLTPERMEEIRAFFGPKAEVIASFKEKKSADEQKTAEDILEYLKRRPAGAEDLRAALGMTRENAERLLEELTENGKVQSVEHFGKRWWEWAGEEKTQN